jgi:hypothetical protein
VETRLNPDGTHLLDFVVWQVADLTSWSVGAYLSKYDPERGVVTYSYRRFWWVGLGYPSAEAATDAMRRAAPRTGPNHHEVKPMPELGELTRWKAMVEDCDWRWHYQGPETPASA